MNALRLSVSFILLIVLVGCFSHITNTRARYISDSELVKLDIKNPVAINNSNLNNEEIELCAGLGHAYYGNLFKYTESSIGIIKNAFERQGIIIDDKSDKILNISVKTAKCSKMSNTVMTKLNVKTGNGIEKEYEKSLGVFSSHAFTRAFENTMVGNVQEMLNDKEIIDYLKN